MKKLKDWEPVIEKLNKRLSDWKMRTMSFGGRLVLVKSVLSSLPLYYFSLFRAPSCVLKSIECLRRSFFWGGSGSGSKISWVKWDNVISSYENGGLNIGSLKCKNLALLGKWWWRFKTESTSLWAKVIRSIYGVNGGLEVGSDIPHSTSTSVWSNIIVAGSKLEKMNINFKNSFVRQIGDGSETRFWLDHWIGENKLSILFPRLFRLERMEDVRICNRITGDDIDFSANWEWSRSPARRSASELATLEGLLQSFCFDFSKPDTWKWNLASNGIFTVKRLATLADEHSLQVGNSVDETIRNCLTPKKIEILVWRIIRKRIPVRVELDKRGIDLHSVRCPLSDDDLETIEHCIIFCKHSMEIWERIFQWWGFGSFTNLNLNELLRGNAPTQISCFGKKIWQAVEWVSVYFIWSNRNNKAFNGKAGIGPGILHEIQVKSFDWISHRAKGRKFEWLSWLNDPQVYLLN